MYLLNVLCRGSSCNFNYLESKENPKETIAESLILPEETLIKEIMLFSTFFYCQESISKKISNDNSNEKKMESSTTTQPRSRLNSTLPFLTPMLTWTSEINKKSKHLLPSVEELNKKTEETSKKILRYFSKESAKTFEERKSRRIEVEKENLFLLNERAILLRSIEQMELQKDLLERQLVSTVETTSENPALTVMTVKERESSVLETFRAYQQILLKLVVDVEVWLKNRKSFIIFITKIPILKNKKLKTIIKLEKQSLEDIFEDIGACLKKTETLIRFCPEILNPVVEILRQKVFWNMEILTFMSKNIKSGTLCKVSINDGKLKSAELPITVVDSIPETELELHSIYCRLAEELKEEGDEISRLKDQLQLVDVQFE